MRGGSGPLLKVVKDQRLAFLVVGTANTAVGYFWFIGLQLLIGERVGYMVVLLLAHVASVLCAFVLYRHLVFRVRGNVWRDLARFELVYLTALGINVVMLPLLVELGGLPVLLAQTIVVVVTAVLSFFAHRSFSFRRANQRPDTGTDG